MDIFGSHYSANHSLWWLFEAHCVSLASVGLHCLILLFPLLHFPFLSHPYPLGLRIPSNLLLFAPGSVCRRTWMKEASVDSHGPLYVPLLQPITLCMTACPFPCLDKKLQGKGAVSSSSGLSLGRESSRCSIDEWVMWMMSEWWISLSTILEFLV